MLAWFSVAVAWVFGGVAAFAVSLALGLAFSDVRIGDSVSAMLLAMLVAGPVIVLLVLMRVRTRVLTVTEDGLVAQRDGYRVSVRWDDFEKVVTKRMGPFMIDVLAFRAGHVEPTSRRPVPRKVFTAGADRMIQIGVYDVRWRDGLTGQMIARVTDR